MFLAITHAEYEMFDSKSSNLTFSFSSKEPKKVLRAINQYIPSERLVRSLSFFDVLKRNFMPSKKNAKIKK